MASPSFASPPIGWPLLPVPDAQGRLGYPPLEESIRQTIRVLLLTRPGEQLMRPEFGAGIENFLHAPNTLTTRRQIRDVVTGALERWEPRIVLDRVEVWEVEEQPGHVRIEIAYRLRRTGLPQQIGLVLEMEG